MEVLLIRFTSQGSEKVERSETEESRRVNGWCIETKACPATQELSPLASRDQELK